MYYEFFNEKFLKNVFGEWFCFEEFVKVVNYFGLYCGKVFV